MSVISNAIAEVGIFRACAAIELPRSTWYRWNDARPAVMRHVTVRRIPSNALSTEERQSVLDVLHEPRFVDMPPLEIYETLLREHIYLCSERTMYRILKSNQEVRERRNQARRPVYTKPELIATGANQVWTWDITKLKGPTKGTWFCLYTIMDIFTRYVVGWMLAENESAILAKHLIAETLVKQDIQSGQLTIHADRGASMKSNEVEQLLKDKGVTKSHNRPHTSNDNPFSESQFKTTKYHPGYPERFESVDHACEYLKKFLAWYNNEHHHTGIERLTPSELHHGKAEQVLAATLKVKTDAFNAHPARFNNKPPKAKKLPTAVYINPPKPEEKEGITIQ